MPCAHGGNMVPYLVPNKTEPYTNYKQDEMETLMKEVAEFYLSQPRVVDVKYINQAIIKLLHK